MTLRVLSFSTYVLVFGIHTYMVHSRHAYVQYVTNRLRANIYTYSYIHKTEYANRQLLSYLVVDDLCKFDFVCKNKP